ncbi:hypothetical protein BDQ12DRAFT_641934 [Crucibulum laeve]|uniref:DNA polymerase n=1 Tax=Crucibulum laeve TaxID=68775 RepID=A0A5C3MHR4_9AGAR|nr:hypothetical protein BDQ12DRAFT_641934 [Crucibulum laeve]
MPSKRSNSALRSSSDSSSSRDSLGGRSSKRQRSNSTISWDGRPNAPLKIYIVQSKLEPETITELYDLVERHQRPSGDEDNGQHLDVQLCSEVQDADIVITGIHMKRRLERHIDWRLAREKAIVTPDWLRASVKEDHPVPCGNYSAISELHDETAENCPDKDQCDQCEGKQKQQDKEQAHLQNYPTTPPTAESYDGENMETLKSLEPDTTSRQITRNWGTRYACTRASPLVCPNQALAIELNILHRSRELEGKAANALSYERAVAIIKSYPKIIDSETFEEDIVKLPHLGKKILTKIEEFVENGHIKESRTIAASERFQSLSLFSTVYGVGPVTARNLYAIGLRKIEDMERYYDVPPDIDSTYLNVLELELVTPNGKRIIGLSKNKLPEVSIKIALAIRKDLDIKIPRAEVQTIHDVVMRELEKLQVGCISTIVGGYRRGKLESNDVDIVISHPDLKTGAAKIKGLCTQLTKHLYKQGYVTHVMHLSGFHEHNALRTEHWDSLEKALTVFVLPPKEGGRKLHRRVDLIFAPPEAYWTAVIGWSGSKMFQRDLRLWAKVERGMKFDSSGLTRRHDSKLFIPRSEKEVFDILGLEWIDPRMRNADV